MTDIQKSCEYSFKISFQEFYRSPNTEGQSPGYVPGRYLCRGRRGTAAGRVPRGAAGGSGRRRTAPADGAPCAARPAQDGPPPLPGVGSTGASSYPAGSGPGALHVTKAVRGRGPAHGAAAAAARALTGSAARGRAQPGPARLRWRREEPRPPPARETSAQLPPHGPRWLPLPGRARARCVVKVAACKRAVQRGRELLRSALRRGREGGAPSPGRAVRKGRGGAGPGAAPSGSASRAERGRRWAGPRVRKGPLPVGVALPHAHVWPRGGRGFSRGAHVRGAARVAPPRGGGAMELAAARRAVLAAVRGTRAADLPRLLHWMRNSHDFDELVVSNNDVVLRNIAEDLRNRLPIEAMFTSEHQAVQKIQQHPLPMIHVDAFLYDDDVVDSLCEEGKMSRSYCTECGSYKTASLEFISHSFSLMELKFLYQHVLPDLTGKGYLYSSASQLYGVEMNADFCQLQEMMVTKYEFIDRIKVVHADICTQPSLLQKADVVIMNNVFEYFLDRQEQARAWEFIACNVRKRGSLLVTVPSLEESLSKLQADVQLSQWVEEVQLNYDVYMEKDIDREALEQIHLYKIL
uniref:uncharacterized protein n=1 Tax=Lonchura striata TaxID=40157 RepID=UPI001293C529|nr:uncharacterized protein LOC110477190 [Lonchura striata domestica]